MREREKHHMHRVFIHQHSLQTRTDRPSAMPSGLATPHRQTSHPANASPRPFPLCLSVALYIWLEYARDERGHDVTRESIRRQEPKDDTHAQLPDLGHVLGRINDLQNLAFRAQGYQTQHARQGQWRTSHREVRLDAEGGPPICDVLHLDHHVPRRGPRQPLEIRTHLPLAFEWREHGPIREGAVFIQEVLQSFPVPVIHGFVVGLYNGAAATSSPPQVRQRKGVEAAWWSRLLTVKWGRDGGDEALPLAGGLP
mmetsp:Transcript_27061/g.67434  ORF Transcript_27061/g.67434 Transcript_27061/m.67434 type:complete len:254 (+) Transcript_27061:247-1008(+)